MSSKATFHNIPSSNANGMPAISHRRCRAGVALPIAMWLFLLLATGHAQTICESTGSLCTMNGGDPAVDANCYERLLTVDENDATWNGVTTDNEYVKGLFDVIFGDAYGGNSE